jgi:uncharacterized membrane protein
VSDTNTRSIVKTLTWRLTGSTATFLIAYFLIGSITVAGVLGITQLIFNTVLYYFHERIWNKINWGKNG